MTARSVLLALAMGFALVSGPSLVGAADTSVAVASAPAPSVGALFVPSVAGSAVLLGVPHSCTASVVHSPGHDLVLTAAHCIVATGAAYQFAPGYDAGRLPYGLWTVVRVHVNPAWTLHHDPQHDYAFLTIARRTWHGANHAIEDVVGANTLGPAPAPGTVVTITGYASGSQDRPLTCTTTVRYTQAFPTFDCEGFVGGTSGSPWLVGRPGAARVVGVIGGLHQGGCTDATSYSSAFGADIARDYLRAVGDKRGDIAPPRVGDGC